MKNPLSSVQNKVQPALFLRVYLILAPLLFFIYFAVNAGLRGESFAVYLTSQPINPVMLLIALLSFFWFAVLSTAQNQPSKKIWKRTMIAFMASNLLTGNVVAIILGYMSIKQGTVLKENKEVAVPNLPLLLTVIIGILTVLSLFVCFAFIRITLA
ncbi:MAG: hypothetical protein ABS916_08370 [Carnobacterium sp.]|uniref:hypothetical protein n=1 Tax=Carnobacterium sp. TaxID=48221 RepID=UPI003315433B